MDKAELLMMFGSRCEYGYGPEVDLYRIVRSGNLLKVSGLIFRLRTKYESTYQQERI